MTEPFIFATTAAGNVPASQLDANYAKPNVTIEPSQAATYADVSVLTSGLWNVPGTSAVSQQFAGVFRLTNSAGSLNPTGAGKNALGAEMIANSGSGQSTASGAVITVNSGVLTTVTFLAKEIDVNNNSGVDAQDGEPGTSATGNRWFGGVLITGAGSSKTNFALCIGGNNMTRYGISITSGSTLQADMISYSAATAFLWDKGSRAHGLYANDATYSTNFITGPSGSFLVSPTGVVTGLSYKVGANQVVGARDTGWVAMTGSPDKGTVYATGTVTLPQLAGRVAQLQASLTTHGLIGT